MMQRPRSVRKLPFSFAIGIIIGLVAVSLFTLMYFFIATPMPLASTGVCTPTTCVLKPVHGLSMEPTLHDGDFIRIQVLTAVQDAFQRGDLVVIDFNIDDDLRVKRVIGVSGDSISFDAQGNMYVNAALVHSASSLGLASTKDAFAFSRFESSFPIIIPSEKVLVLGDNRAASIDSRTWGLVTQRFVVGKVVEIIPSTASDANTLP